MTAFVAEDGQGGHIIISGGSGYQDSSVVSISAISGHQVVSTVSDSQLMTLAGRDNVPVTMAGGCWFICKQIVNNARYLFIYNSDASQ